MSCLLMKKIIIIINTKYMLPHNSKVAKNKNSLLLPTKETSAEKLWYLKRHSVLPVLVLHSVSYITSETDP